MYGSSCPHSYDLLGYSAAHIMPSEAKQSSVKLSKEGAVKTERTFEDLPVFCGVFSLSDVRPSDAFLLA